MSMSRTHESVLLKHNWVRLSSAACAKYSRPMGGHGWMTIFTVLASIANLGSWRNPVKVDIVIHPV